MGESKVKAGVDERVKRLENISRYILEADDRLRDVMDELSAIVARVSSNPIDLRLMYLIYDVIANARHMLYRVKDDIEYYKFWIDECERK